MAKKSVPLESLVFLSDDFLSDVLAVSQGLSIGLRHTAQGLGSGSIGEAWWQDEGQKPKSMRGPQKNEGQRPKSMRGLQKIKGRCQKA